MALKTLGETGFAWRTREAFLDAEFEITLSRNGKSTSEKIATEGWNRDKAVCSKTPELGSISLGRALTPAKSSLYCSDTQHCVILGFKRLICLSRSKPEISIKSPPSCPISVSWRSFCETGKCLPLKGGGLRLLHTSRPGAVSLGGCPNFVVYYWQSPALLYGIICHITVYKMFPQGTFLYNVYIQYDVSVRKKHWVKLMSKQRHFMSVFQGISGKYDDWHLVWPPIWILLHNVIFPAPVSCCVWKSCSGSGPFSLILLIVDAVPASCGLGRDAGGL